LQTTSNKIGTFIESLTYFALDENRKEEIRADDQIIQHFVTIACDFNFILKSYWKCPARLTQA